MRRFLMFPVVRIVIAAVLLIAPMAAIHVLLQVAGVDAPNLVDAAIALGASVLALLVVTRFIERRSLSEVGLRPDRGLLHTVVGLGVGAALITAVIAVFGLLGWYRLQSGPEGSFSELSVFMVKTFLTIVLFAAFEEVAFRGIVFRIVEESLGTVLALLISGAIFGFAHAMNPGASLFSSVAIAAEAGILLGAAFVLTRSLWFAIGIHAGWNFVLGPVFDAAVSGLDTQALVTASIDGPVLWTGGSFGPEASLITVMLCTCAGLAMLWIAHRRGQTIPIWFRRRVEAVTPAVT